LPAISVGQNIVSPLPSDAPSMIALGPTRCLTFGTFGRSASRNDAPSEESGYSSVLGASSSVA
jgi:hypothetical protein